MDEKLINEAIAGSKEADTIMVVLDGKIAEMGNHEELMKKGGFYSTLYNSQFE